MRCFSYATAKLRRIELMEERESVAEDVVDTRGGVVQWHKIGI